MMKRLFILLAAIFTINTAVSASSADFFKLDAQQIAVEMADLDALEQFVEANEGITQQLLLDQGNVLAANLNLSNNLNNFGASGFTFDDVDWGSFAWGFCCWPVGFFVVAINNEKTNEQKISYWIGLAASVLLGGLSTPVYLAAG